MDGNNTAINRILEEAANLVRREKEAAGDAELAEGYKGRQIERLKEFATIRNLWIDWGKLPVAFLRRGGENEVFTGEDDFVIKLNNFAFFFHRRTSKTYPAQFKMLQYSADASAFDACRKH